jgi:dTDP-glucose 4,6-dehydratase
LRPLAQIDLDHVLEHTARLWAELRSGRILLTGGTGFFGCWLVETFLHANKTLGLDAHLSVLSRNPRAFARRAPWLCADPALTLIEGDIRTFAFPPGHFGCLIHAAADSVVPASSSPAQQYAIIVDGTRRVLDFARAAGTGRLLFVSSGAVYGPQPLSISHIAEEQPFAPTDSAYTFGKRDAESLCLHADPSLRSNIARGFAFLGPHLPLDAHFAAGNFLRNALEGHDVAIFGDGTPLRSYLYAADLAIWLWTILLKGSGRAYNVGSEHTISIQGLAGRVIAGVDPSLHIRVAHQQNWPPPAPPRYVPSTRRARSELGLESWISLDEAIRRTAAWHRDAIQL